MITFDILVTTIFGIRGKFIKDELPNTQAHHQPNFVTLLFNLHYSHNITCIFKCAQCAPHSLKEFARASNNSAAQFP